MLLECMKHFLNVLVQDCWLAVSPFVQFITVLLIVLGGLLHHHKSQASYTALKIWKCMNASHRYNPVPRLFLTCDVDTWPQTCNCYPKPQGSKVTHKIAKAGCLETNKFTGVILLSYMYTWCTFLSVHSPSLNMYFHLLSLYKNGIDNEGITYLVDGLQECTTLLTLRWVFASLHVQPVICTKEEYRLMNHK